MEYIVPLKEEDNLLIDILSAAFIKVSLAKKIKLILLESIAWFISRKRL